MGHDKLHVSYEEFVKLMNCQVDPTTTPGIPFNRYGSKNSDVFGYTPILGYEGDNVKILYDTVMRRLTILVEGPVCDPINLFVKQEPHKEKKVKAGAWRLIHGVSIVDQMVAVVL